MKILFCDNIAGISGNMFAASFIDAGIVSEHEIKNLPEKVGLKDYGIKIEVVTKSSISSHHLEIVPKTTKLKSNLNIHKSQNSVHPHEHHHLHDHHPYLDIIKQIDNSDLNKNVKNNSKGIYKILAETESKVHGISVDEVMFHEVGEPDSIIDVVLAGYCIEKAGVDKVYSTPIKLGRGSIKIKHGVYPVPPPASLLLAKDMKVVSVPDDIKEQNIELSTPTGLSILKFLNPEFVNEIPTGKITAQGYGAGTLDLNLYPNVFRIIFLETESAELNLPYIKDSVVEISCNIDDQTPERTAWCMEQLFSIGALDSWISTIHSKKNRVVFCLSVLAKENDRDKIADWLLRNTTTFGIRYRNWDRMILDRKSEIRKIDGNEISFKVGLTTSGEELKAKPEFEEIRKVWDRKSSKS